MREIVFRVITKFDTQEGVPKPELILIDGGRGHLNTALKVVKELKAEMNVLQLQKSQIDLYFLMEGKYLWMIKDLHLCF